MRGSAFGASCWLFLFSTLGGAGVSGGIVCTMFSDWFGVAVMGGIFTLGTFGATLGGETGRCFDDSVGSCCFGWTVAR